MLAHHELDASYKASVHALCHASILKGMTATAATVPSMTNSVGDQKIHSRTRVVIHKGSAASLI